MKKIEKILSAAVAAAMMLSLAACGGEKQPAPSAGDDTPDATVQVNAPSEDNFVWAHGQILALTETGAQQSGLTIPARCTGFGSMILSDVENQIKSVTFESDADVELNGAFGYSDTLEQIQLPANLTVMGINELAHCPMLRSIHVPAGVKDISDGAFEYCESMTEAVIDGAARIGAYAFNGCTALEKVTLADSVEEIGDNAFNNCFSLTEITLPANLKTVGEFAFAISGLRVINVPAEMELTSWVDTSFVTDQEEPTVNVVAGSWIEAHFEEVFGQGFIMNVQ